MKKLHYDDLKEGMVLEAAIYDDRSGAELLSAGTVLTLRHISLIRNIGITDIVIKDVAAEQVVDLSEEVEKLLQDEHKNEQIFEPAARNRYNRNMEVNVLTGEGNLPIDVKHEHAIKETRQIFDHIKDSGELDLQGMKTHLVSTLPDMVRNNDVLMRLNQLQRTDDYTFEHSMRVSILATMIGKWLGFSQTEMLELSEAGMLYDIGKLSIPEEILKKPGALTAEEWDVVRRHPQNGYSILLGTKGVSQNVKYAALHHHERMDGSGYPLRLRSKQIHDFAKIIMVCDVFDALTNDRPYKNKISEMLALDYLMWNSDKLFDPEVVFIFKEGISAFFISKQCRLSNGKTGKIVYPNKGFPTRPIVQVGDDFIDLAKDRSIDIEEIF
ncbi:MAG: HD-GYP domain-containing protein [Bacillota bacterium]|nr:HD-GYP domain-containing protein [Bacillota bacterium]